MLDNLGRALFMQRALCAPTSKPSALTGKRYLNIKGCEEEEEEEIEEGGTREGDEGEAEAADARHDEHSRPLRSGA